MALSGTLETFSLPDVLRLLSSTNKTGLLALDGDRGRGRIWVRDGAIVAAEADRAANEQVEGVAFELLRFVDATFEFDSGAEPADEGEGRPVDDVLAEAESRLAEWREIEAVVPSLDVWARMVAELDDERRVTPDEWRILAQVGTGATGHALADRLGQGEYDVCRQLRDLIEAGMVELDEAPAAPTAPVTHADAAWDRVADEPTFVEPALDHETVTSLGTDLASFVAVGTAEEPVVVDPVPLVPDVDRADEDHDEPGAYAAMVDTGDADELDPADPVAEAESEDDDLLSELSQLSPKAAAAVEATWGDDARVVEPAESDADDPAPEAEAGSGDDIDQNLLLRFLSSTKQ